MEIPHLDTDARTRDGASIVLETARERGVDVCFANPGTTEMPFVVALDRVAGVRPILGCSRASARAPRTVTAGWPASPR